MAEDRMALLETIREAAGDSDQLARITAVGLDPVSRPSRRECGRDDRRVDAEGGELTVEVVAGGAGPVAGAHPRRFRPAAREPTDLLGRVRGAFLVDVAIGPQQGHADAGLADVEAEVGDGRMLEHGRRPPLCGTFHIAAGEPRRTQASTSPCWLAVVPEVCETRVD